MERAARKSSRTPAEFWIRLILVVAVLPHLGGTLVLAQRGARDPYLEQRLKMVEEEIVAAGVKNPRVIESMRNTPRHEFMRAPERKWAYLDMALPIGEGQTISPPFIVAYMTEAIDPQPEDRVLEIGTGSGYQAAVLSPLVKEVYSIEIVEPLGKAAARALRRLRYKNVFTKVGDGYKGWEEHAPFNKIIVTCSPEDVPQPLVDQLAEGGTMIIPVGERYQQTLYLYTKQDGKLVEEKLLPTLFVPMTGQAESERDKLPDPLHPKLANGGFEELEEQGNKPARWHYQRQLTLVEADDAPEGKHYARFENSEPGRGAQALQGMAVDGRRIGGLLFKLHVRAEGARQGAAADQVPMLFVMFYDQQRAVAGTGWVGPWLGTSEWQELKGVVEVPLKTREAIVRVGLNGATGVLCCDDVRLAPVPRAGQRLEP